LLNFLAYILIILFPLFSLLLIILARLNISCGVAGFWMLLLMMLAFPTISAMDNKASIANRPDLLAICQGKYIVQTS
jgi:hypothetical protein